MHFHMPSLRNWLHVHMPPLGNHMHFHMPPLRNRMCVPTGRQLKNVKTNGHVCGETRYEGTHMEHVCGEARYESRTGGLPETPP